MTRVGIGGVALALVVLPALGLLGTAGSTGSPTLVDQQLDSIVQAGHAPPTIDPVIIPAADMPLATPFSSGRGGQPNTTLTVLGPGGTTAPIANSAFLPGSSRGIPSTVLAAYQHAADVLASSDPQCGLPWWVLAGIGRIESGHAAGGHVDSHGLTIGRILGPRLDGTTPGTDVVLDTDQGALDGDPLFDRAVGPMQFLPSTWATVASDGNGDGRMDPNNVFDAALGAARYLCGGAAHLDTDAGLRAAVMRYNHSAAYVENVLSWGRSYRDGVTPLANAAGPIPTTSHAAGTASTTTHSTGAGVRPVVAAPSGSAAPWHTGGSQPTSHAAPTPSTGAPGSTTSPPTTSSTAPTPGYTPTSTGAATSATPTASTTSNPAASPPTSNSGPSTSGPTPAG
jgi:hypothetical protein